jgi:para-aminobenzoate synthetase/4-amino-4-deoxychorismate lyase
MFQINDVLLRDDRTGAWKAFRQPQKIVQAWGIEEVTPALEEVQAAVVQHGLWAAGFLSYEASPAFDTALVVRQSTGFPLLWFGLYHEPIDVILPEIPMDAEIGLGEWEADVDRGAYDWAIDRIKYHIGLGDTYQVNYTIRLRASFEGEGWPLFLRIANNQQAGYAGFIRIENFEICSASPELFFTLDGQEICARPMKGTAKRGRTLDEDRAQIDWLHHSEKNRAENVMIVDMLRNDIGRIAEIGSVQVPSLFEVERYPTVLQMTSTVTARTQANFCQIMAALFPCASITGAPKPRTMQIISDLEDSARRIYTGCMGYYAPGRQAQFNVAIRTILIDRQLKQAEYGVGGGIVWDSSSEDEYQECLLKAQVLRVTRPVFDLLESLLWTPEDGYFLLDRHLLRMADSAEYFRFAFSADMAHNQLQELSAKLPSEPHKVRLICTSTGLLRCQAERLTKPFDQPVDVALASWSIDLNDPFLYHKTTWRTVYDTALADNPSAQDVILFNQRDEITETCWGNLVVRLGDRLFTPPVESGLLPGVFRAHLLEAGLVTERVISKADLAWCEEIFVVNSVRGWRKARLVMG